MPEIVLAHHLSRPPAQSPVIRHIEFLLYSGYPACSPVGKRLPEPPGSGPVAARHGTATFKSLVALAIFLISRRISRKPESDYLEIIRQ